MKIIICAVALCLFQITSCGVQRTTTTTQAPSSSTFHDLATEAEQTLTTLHGKFLDFWGVKSNDELTTLVQTSSSSYAERLKELVGEISEDAKNSQGELQTAARGFQSKVNEIITNIQTENPDLVHNTEHLQQEFETRLRAVLVEAEKFGNVVKETAPELQQNFEHLTRQIIDNTVQTARNVSTQVENKGRTNNRH